MKLAPVLAIALLVGCGSSNSEGEDGAGGAAAGTGGASAGMGGSAGTGATGGSGGFGDYPPGPYGDEVGLTMPNLRLAGYLNESGGALSNARPFVSEFTMDDLRQSGRPYAMVHFSEFF